MKSDPAPINGVWMQESCPLLAGFARGAGESESAVPGKHSFLALALLLLQ